jgi:hypothetical protein
MQRLLIKIHRPLKIKLLKLLTFALLGLFYFLSPCGGGKKNGFGCGFNGSSFLFANAG